MDLSFDWDADASVWYVANSDVPGLAAGASTLAALLNLLSYRIPELLLVNG